MDYTRFYAEFADGSMRIDEGRESVDARTDDGGTSSRENAVIMDALRG